MSKTTLGEVVKKANRLSVEDRLRLFDQVFQADGIDPASRLSDPDCEALRAQYSEGGRFEVTRNEGTFSVFYSEKAAAIMLDNRYVFRVFFYSENLRESRLQLSCKAAHPDEDIALLDAETFVMSGDIIELLPKLSWMLCHCALELATLAFRDLHGETDELLQEETGEDWPELRPEDIYNFRQRATARDIEKVVEPFVKEMKNYFLIAQGGARQSRKAFVWNPEKALEFYEAVNSLPSIGGKSMWEYASEQLKDNDFDPDTVAWLRSRPSFDDVPEDLLREAAAKWKLHAEEWDSLPAKNSPQAYAFRHACSKLGIPSYAYNTLRIRFYEGKKQSNGNDDVPF